VTHFWSQDPTPPHLGLWHILQTMLGNPGQIHIFARVCSNLLGLQIQWWMPIICHALGQDKLLGDLGNDIAWLYLKCLFFSFKQKHYLHMRRVNRTLPVYIGAAVDQAVVGVTTFVVWPPWPPFPWPWPWPWPWLVPPVLVVGAGAFVISCSTAQEITYLNTF